MKSSAVARAVLEKGGPSIQDQCSKGKPKGIKTGEVFCTNAGNLQARKIYHIALSAWDPTEKALEIARGVLQECLSKASDEHYTSIALPAFGTGNLNYPHDQVASLIFEGIAEFSAKNKMTSLKDVRVVLYDKDHGCIDAFKSYVKSIEATKTPPPRAIRHTGSTKNDKFRGGPVVNSVLTETGLQIILKKGTLLFEDCDVLINETSRDLDLSKPYIPHMLIFGGQSIQEECAKKAPNGIAYGEVVCTSGGELAVKAIYHAALMNWDDFGSEPMKIAGEVLQKCLLMASSSGFTSMALNPFGAGNIAYPHTQVASLMYETIERFCRSNKSTTLKDVRIILDSASIKVFEAYVESLLNLGSQASPDRAPAAKHSKPGPPVPPKPKLKQRYDQIVLRIYTTEEDSKQLAVRVVDQASREITRSCAFEKQRHKQLVKELSDNQIDEIRSVASKYDVLLGLDPHLHIEGETKSVHCCFTEITEILHAAQRKIDAEVIMYKQLKWQYQDSATGAFKSYSMQINYIIEKARHIGEPANWTTNEGIWSVDFDSMKASLKGSSQRTLVIRKMIEGADTVNLPKEWSLMPPRTPFLLVKLRSLSTEYRKVEQKFRATCKYEIVEIQRVQCPAQYQCYTVKKQHVTENCRPGTQVERQLFHGTSFDTLVFINTNGFNRSYCGKNLTVYGDGVYFAVEAEYSADPTYSRPDREGHCYMYLCKVITGEYTRGATGLIEPPPLDPKQPNIRYNSVVDNMQYTQMFVIFQDMQAYPEYLITFRSPHVNLTWQID